mgnify:CR=1 FL=1
MARTAYSYVRFVNRKAARTEDIAGRSFALLTLVNRLPSVEDPELPDKAPPESGHGSQMLAASGGQRGSDDFGEVSYRLTYHDLLDNRRGFLDGAQIQGLGITLRSTESGAARLEELDLVSIRSPFVQNLLLDRVLSPIEGSTADLLDNTTLSLGKYFGSDLFLEALLRLRSPALGAGAPSGSGLESDLELSLEWATPFFLLEWSFIPQTQETLYVTDNSLSLRWRLTY